MTQLGRWTWTNAEAEAVIDRYEGVVRMVARRLRRSMAVGLAMDEDDLRAEGRVAVLEALRTYAGFGLDERSWVKMRVRQRMIDAIRRLDLRTREEFRLAARRSAGQPLEDREYERCREVAARRHVSMDASHDDEESLVMRLRDSMIPSAEHCAEANARQELLRDALTRIPERHRQAIELGVFEGMALREIGRRMGISESRVCQLQKSAVEQLRKAVLEEAEQTAA